MYNIYVTSICIYICPASLALDMFLLHLCNAHIMLYVYIYDTGWRRPIGILISWITFRKLATNYRALLRKMIYKEDKASYESLPPCTCVSCS